VVTVNLAADGQVDIAVRVSAELLLADIGPDYADTNDSPNARIYDELRALEPAALATRFADFSPEFLANIGLVADGQPLELRYEGIDVPPVGDLELARDSVISLSAGIPPGTSELQWLWPRQYASNVLRIVPAGNPEGIVSVWLQPGEQAEPYRLSETGGRSTSSVIADYIVIGFEHIVPLGIDHILFVLGLFLLSLRLAPLLWQVSAFTLAHTITLGLTIYGVVSLSPSIVEPLIALSIAYVGIENCLSSKLHPWRVMLVFLFGLLHGMGFAGVLNEIGLPEGEFLTALISFNVGVELGQLAVIAGALLLVGWFRNASWYRSAVVIPGSLLIAATGLYWTWERIFG